MRSILKKYPASAEFLLDILHDLQEFDPKRYLSAEALRAAADHVGVPIAEVVSTATFYTMFSLKPRGLHIVRLCESPPCQLMGAESVLDILQKHLGVHVGETTKDGMFTLETSSCLGVCGVAPAMMVDAELYGNLTRERVVAIIEQVRRGHGPS